MQAMQEPQSGYIIPIPRAEYQYRASGQVVYGDLRCHRALEPARVIVLLPRPGHWSVIDP